MGFKEPQLWSLGGLRYRERRKQVLSKEHFRGNPIPKHSTDVRGYPEGQLLSGGEGITPTEATSRF